MRQHLADLHSGEGNLTNVLNSHDASIARIEARCRAEIAELEQFDPSLSFRCRNSFLRCGQAGFQMCSRKSDQFRRHGSSF